jgi:uncharacterized membrane protein
VDPEGIVERVESCIESVIHNSVVHNSQLTGEIGRISNKVDAALAANRITDNNIKMLSQLSQLTPTQNPIVSEFQTQVFDHFKAKDIASSNKDADLIKQLVQNQNSQETANKSLISLKMKLLFGAFVVAVLAMSFSYAFKAVSEAVAGNIRFSMNVEKPLKEKSMFW